MSPKGVKVSEVLKALVPKDQEELSVLQTLLSFAQRVRPTEISADARNLLAEIPEEAQKYMHGLVEALEIYQSIHGSPIPIQSITLSDQSVRQLKQIRDMCLEDGLRSIY